MDEDNGDHDDDDVPALLAQLLQDPPVAPPQPVHSWPDLIIISITRRTIPSIITRRSAGLLPDGFTLGFWIVGRVMISKHKNWLNIY